MPFLAPLIPIFTAIAPIAAAGAGLAGLADTIYNQVNAPSGKSATPTPAELTSQAEQQVAAEQKTRQAAAVQDANLAPSIVSNTGGSVSPDYLATVTSLLTGNGDLANSDAIKQAIAQLMGNSTPSFGDYNVSSPGLTGGTNG